MISGKRFMALPAFRTVILPRFSDAVLLPTFPEGKQGKANQKEHHRDGKADEEGSYHALTSFLRCTIPMQRAFPSRLSP